MLQLRAYRFTEWPMAMLMALVLPLGACMVQFPRDIQPQGMHEVAQSGGWRLEVAQLQGWESGAGGMFPAGDGKSAYGINGAFRWWRDVSDLQMIRDEHGNYHTRLPADTSILHDPMKLFDLSTGLPWRTLDGDEARAIFQQHAKEGRALEPVKSPDGKWLLAAIYSRVYQSDAATFEVRDARTGQVAGRVTIDLPVAGATWSPDSLHFEAVNAHSWRVIRVALPAAMDRRETVAWKPLQILKSRETVTSEKRLSASSDDTLILQGHALWRVGAPKAGEPATDSVRSNWGFGRITQDGKHILVGINGGATVYDVDSSDGAPVVRQARRLTLDDVNWRSASIRVYPAGASKCLMSVNSDRLVMWDIAQGVKLWDVARRGPRWIMVAANGTRAVGVDEAGCRVCDLEPLGEWQRLNLPEGDEGRMDVEAISADGRIMAISMRGNGSSSEPRLHFYDLQARRDLCSLDAMGYGGQGLVALSDDGSVALVANGNELLLVDSATGRRLAYGHHGHDSNSDLAIREAVFTSTGRIWTASEFELCEWVVPSKEEQAGFILPEMLQGAAPPGK